MWKKPIRREYNKKWVKLKRERNQKLEKKKDLFLSLVNENEDSDDYSTQLETAEFQDESLPAAATSCIDTRTNKMEIEVVVENNAKSTTPEPEPVSESAKKISKYAESLSDFTSSETSSDENQNDNLRNFLADWVVRYNISHSSANDLLQYLKNSAGHSTLPTNCKTLLRTPHHIEVQKKSCMDYYFFGVISQLTAIMQKYISHTKECPHSLFLSFNIDGLPLFKSSKTCFWPILCSIKNIKNSPIFPVAMCCGSHKPTGLAFMDDTIKDLERLHQHGFALNDHKIAISIHSIICDAPAKAFVKAIKLYSGYFGCDKCAQKGEHIGRMTYPITESLPQRTDESFRLKSNPEHHHHDASSPFCQLLSVDMVSDFPIDYMHQVCLGVMKKLLIHWCRGKTTMLSSGNVNAISNELAFLRPFIPSCFQRKPRSLNELERWKATEFRQFLLYTGKVVLKRFLPRDYYEHFLLLNLGMAILVNEELTFSYCNYAHELLVRFVKRCSDLYGPKFLVYNVHSLVHISSDATRYGSLDACSAFPFENYMQKLKRLVRSGKEPLRQVIHRLEEGALSCNFEHTTGVCLSDKSPNNAFIIKENATACVEVEALCGAKCLCRVYDHPQPLFSNPCDSSIIGAFHVKVGKYQMSYLDNSTLHERAICFKFKSQFIFLALNHRWETD